MPSVISVGFFHGNFIKVFGTAPGAAAARTRAGACTAGNTGTRTRAAGMVGVIRTAAAPPGTTAALALLNDAVKKGGVMASSHVGGLSGAFIPVTEDAGMIDAARP